MLIIDVARVAHEANRALCLGLGDTSQKPWDDAPTWQRDSAISGVVFHLNNPDATASSSHDNWLEEKARMGWIYGRIKDEALKQHPCIVPFDHLPAEQQAKDVLFRGVVHALAGLVER